MIKAVIFDLDDTLYEYNSINERAIDVVCERYANILRISSDTFRKAFEWGRSETKSTIRDSAACHNRMIYFQKASEYLKINSIRYTLEMYETYWKYILEHMELRSGVLELFAYLKQKDIKIAICTDLTVQIQHRKLRKLGIWQYIDVLVTSEEAGVEKPDVKIFDLVMKKLNMKAHELIYVGDSLDKDIVGAVNAGIAAIWFNPKRQARKKDLPYVEIESFQEIEEVIMDEGKFK